MAPEPCNAAWLQVFGAAVSNSLAISASPSRRWNKQEETPGLAEFKDRAIHDLSFLFANL
jgi:hypothetical protein